MLRLPTKLLFGFDPVTLRPKSCDLKGPDLLLPIQLISPELLAVACLNIPPQLLRQPRPCFQLPRQHLYKTFIAFIALRLRRGEHGVRERRVGGEPEADEKRQRLIGHLDMLIELVELARHLVNAAAEGRSKGRGGGKK